MPYSNGTYELPPGSHGVSNTTVSSSAYNSVIDDVANAQNAVRPKTAGGTGASTPVGASDNMATTSSDMASAATLNLANASGVVVNVTGTTTITALGTVSSGALRVLIFAGSLTLTHNATSLVLPGGADIQTAAGDVAEFRSKGGGNWICTGYHLASGRPVVDRAVGTTAGTVAAGDDIRIVGAFQAANVIDEDDMSSNSATKVPTQQSVKAYVDGERGIATAWVNFNGTGTVAIRDSFNVSSITDNGTGDYTINFATPMANTNYCLVGSSTYSTTEAWGLSIKSQSTSSVRVIDKPVGVGAQDPTFACAAIFGGR